MNRRNTKHTSVVTEILKKTNGAISHNDILKKMKYPVDRVTVYRILQRLIEDGKVHKVFSNDGKSFFAYSHIDTKGKMHTGNHIHFKCLKCKKIICLDNRVKFKLPKGFISFESNCFVSGYCSCCS